MKRLLLACMILAFCTIAAGCMDQTNTQYPPGYEPDEETEETDEANQT